MIVVMICHCTKKDPILFAWGLLWHRMRDAQRTFFWYDTTIKPTKPKALKKIFRNPIILAKEMQPEMEYHNQTEAQLARKLNVSRARVTQMLNLLKLPEELIREVEELGDHWDRRLVTERMLRGHR